MKHLTGKKIEIKSNHGNFYIGLCTGATDDLVKILVDGEKDETCFFIKNIFSYKIIGEGCTGGYSGLNVYLCKNDNINCLGHIKLSSKELTINDMNCEVCNAKTIVGRGFKCEFGCIGAMEVIPSNVQKILFENMLVERNKKTNDSGRNEVGVVEKKD